MRRIVCGNDVKHDVRPIEKSRPKTNKKMESRRTVRVKAFIFMAKLAFFRGIKLLTSLTPVNKTEKS